jgi:hypothetical protein
MASPIRSIASAVLASPMVVMVVVSVMDAV